MANMQTVFPAPGFTNSTQFLTPFSGFDIAPVSGYTFKNLLAWSQDQSKSTWAKGNGTTSYTNTTSGLTTVFVDAVQYTTSIVDEYLDLDPANMILSPTPNVGQYLRTSVTVTPSTTYTFSFFAKRGTSTEVKYAIVDDTNSVDIISETSYYSSIISSALTRITVTFTTPSNCTSIKVYPVSSSSGYGTTFISGVQLEVGSTATPYQNTTADVSLATAGVVQPTTTYKFANVIKNSHTVKGFNQENIVLDPCNLTKPVEKVNAPGVYTFKSDFIKKGYVVNAIPGEKVNLNVSSLPKRFEKLTGSEQNFKSGRIAPIDFLQNQIFFTPAMNTLKGAGLEVNGLILEATAFDVTNLTKRFETLTSENNRFLVTPFKPSYQSKATFEQLKSSIGKVAQPPKNIQNQLFYAPGMSTLKGAGLEVNGFNQEAYILDALNLPKQFEKVIGFNQEAYILDALNLPKPFEKLTAGEQNLRPSTVKTNKFTANQVFITPTMNTLKGAGLEVNGLITDSRLKTLPVEPALRVITPTPNKAVYSPTIINKFPIVNTQGFSSDIYKSALSSAKLNTVTKATGQPNNVLSGKASTVTKAVAITNKVNQENLANFNTNLWNYNNQSNLGQYDPTYTNTFSVTNTFVAPYTNAYFSYFNGANAVWSPTLNCVATGNFTIEGQFYFTGSGQNTIFCIGDESSGRIVFYHNGADNSLSWNTYGNGATSLTFTTVPKNTWAHIAIVRSGSVLTTYVDAVAGPPHTLSGTLGNANGFQIMGTNPGGIANQGAGLVSNFRYVNGTAIVPSAVPTANLTNVANTKLLLFQTSNPTKDSSTNNNLVYNYNNVLTGRLTAGYTALQFNPTFGSITSNFTSTDVIKLSDATTGYSSLIQTAGATNFSSSIAYLQVPTSSLTSFAASTGSNWTFQQWSPSVYTQSQVYTANINNLPQYNLIRTGTPAYNLFLMRQDSLPINKFKVDYGFPGISRTFGLDVEVPKVGKASTQATAKGVTNVPVTGKTQSSFKLKEVSTPVKLPSKLQYVAPSRLPTNNALDYNLQVTGKTDLISWSVIDWYFEYSTTSNTITSQSISTPSITTLYFAVQTLPRFEVGDQIKIYNTTLNFLAYATVVSATTSSVSFNTISSTIPVHPNTFVTPGSTVLTQSLVYTYQKPATPQERLFYSSFMPALVGQQYDIIQRQVASDPNRYTTGQLPKRFEQVKLPTNVDKSGKINKVTIPQNNIADTTVLTPKAYKLEYQSNFMTKYSYNPYATRVVNVANVGQSFKRDNNPFFFANGASKVVTGSTTSVTLSNTVGQVAFTTPTTTSWTAPAGVTSVSVVVVGGGGSGNANTNSGGGGGGALAYKNNISVVPGNSYTVVVGGASGTSYFKDTTTVAAGGGQSTSTTVGGAGGTVIAGTGFAGGAGGSFTGTGSPYGAGGGGAGGYAGAGGAGGWSSGSTTPAQPTAGIGGGGGGGGAAFSPSNAGSGSGAGGGGVGILGQGADGAAGANISAGTGTQGGGGSGGTGGGGQISNGGTYGGGSGGQATATPGTGAVRIIWGGSRLFPSTLTTDQSTSPFSTTGIQINDWVRITDSSTGSSVITQVVALGASSLTFSTSDLSVLGSDVTTWSVEFWDPTILTKDQVIAYSSANSNVINLDASSSYPAVNYYLGFNAPVDLLSKPYNIGVWYVDWAETNNSSRDFAVNKISKFASDQLSVPIDDLEARRNGKIVVLPIAQDPLYDPILRRSGKIKMLPVVSNPIQNATLRRSGKITKFPIGNIANPNPNEALTFDVNKIRLIPVVSNPIQNATLRRSGKITKFPIGNIANPNPNEAITFDVNKLKIGIKVATVTPENGTKLLSNYPTALWNKNGVVNVGSYDPASQTTGATTSNSFNISSTSVSGNQTFLYYSPSYGTPNTLIRSTDAVRIYDNVSNTEYLTKVNAVNTTSNYISVDTTALANIPSPTYTSYGVQFSGTSSTLTVSAAQSPTFGSNAAWTIELYALLNPETANTLGTLVQRATVAAAAVTGDWTLNAKYLTSSYATIAFVATDFSTSAPALTATLKVGVWNHIAVVRNGTSLTMYINGATASTATAFNFGSNSGASLTVGANIGNTGSANYGGYWVATSPLVGWITSLRILNNRAAYLGAFTPPVPPLSTSQIAAGNLNSVAASDTVLLIARSSTFIDVSSTSATVTAGAGATVVSVKSTITTTAGNTTYPSLSLSNTVLSINFDQASLFTLTDQSPNAYTMKSAGPFPDQTLTAGGPWIGSVNYITQTGSWTSSTSSAGVLGSSLTKSIMDGALLGAKSWSVECGFKIFTNTGPNGVGILGNYGIGWLVGIDQPSTGTFRVIINRSDSTNTNGNFNSVNISAPTVGTWYHLVVSYTAINATSGTMQAFVNGVSQGTAAVDKSLFDYYTKSGNDIIIGSFPFVSGSTIMPSSFDGIRFYSYNPWPVGGFDLPPDWIGNTAQPTIYGNNLANPLPGGVGSWFFQQWSPAVYTTTQVRTANAGLTNWLNLDFSLPYNDYWAMNYAPVNLRKAPLGVSPAQPDNVKPHYHLGRYLTNFSPDYTFNTVTITNNITWNLVTSYLDITPTPEIITATIGATPATTTIVFDNTNKNINPFPAGSVIILSNSIITDTVGNTSIRSPATQVLQFTVLSSTYYSVTIATPNVTLSTALYISPGRTLYNVAEVPFRDTTNYIRYSSTIPEVNFWRMLYSPVNNSKQVYGGNPTASGLSTDISYIAFGKEGLKVKETVALSPASKLSYKTPSVVYPTTPADYTVKITGITDTQVWSSVDWYLDYGVSADVLTSTPVTPGAYTTLNVPSSQYRSLTTIPSSQYSYTTYSTAFYNGGGYLSIAANNAFLFGSNDFTIECWVYPSLINQLMGIVNNWSTGGEFGLEVTATNLVRFFWTNAPSGVSTIQAVSKSTISQSTYTHIAVSRKAGSLYFFINGILDITYAVPDTFYYYNGLPKNLIFGQAADLGGGWVGWISNLRIVNGTGLYYYGFGPDITREVTAVPNTVLILGTSSTLTDAGPYKFTLTPLGAGVPATPLALSPTFYTGLLSTTIDIPQFTWVPGDEIKIFNDETNVHYKLYTTVVSSTPTSITINTPSTPIPPTSYIASGSTVLTQSTVRPQANAATPAENLFFATVAQGIRSSNISISVQNRSTSVDPNRFLVTTLPKQAISVKSLPNNIAANTFRTRTPLRSDTIVIKTDSLLKQFEKMTAGEQNLRPSLIKQLYVPIASTQVHFAPVVTTLDNSGLVVRDIPVVRLPGQLPKPFETVVSTPFSLRVEKVSKAQQARGLDQDAYVLDALNLQKAFEKVTGVQSSQVERSAGIIIKPTNNSQNQLFYVPLASTTKLKLVAKDAPVVVKTDSFKARTPVKGLDQDAYALDALNLQKAFEKVTGVQSSQVERSAGIIIKPTNNSQNQLFSVPRADSLRIPFVTKGFNQDAYVLDVLNLPKPFEKVLGLNQDAYVLDVLNLPKPFEKMTAGEQNLRPSTIKTNKFTANQVFITPTLSVLKPNFVVKSDKNAPFTVLNLKDSYVVKSDNLRLRTDGFKPNYPHKGVPIQFDEGSNIKNQKYPFMTVQVLYDKTTQGKLTPFDVPAGTPDYLFSSEYAAIVGYTDTQNYNIIDYYLDYSTNGDLLIGNQTSFPSLVTLYIQSNVNSGQQRFKAGDTIGLFSSLTLPIDVLQTPTFTTTVVSATPNSVTLNLSSFTKISPDRITYITRITDSVFPQVKVWTNQPGKTPREMLFWANLLTLKFGQQYTTSNKNVGSFGNLNDFAFLQKQFEAVKGETSKVFTGNLSKQLQILKADKSILRLDQFKVSGVLKGERNNFKVEQLPKQFEVIKGDRIKLSVDKVISVNKPKGLLSDAQLATVPLVLPVRFKNNTVFDTPVSSALPKQFETIKSDQTVFRIEQLSKQFEVIKGERARLSVDKMTSVSPLRGLVQEFKLTNVNLINPIRFKNNVVFDTPIYSKFKSSLFAKAVYDKPVSVEGFTKLKTAPFNGQVFFLPRGIDQFKTSYVARAESNKFITSLINKGVVLKGERARIAVGQLPQQIEKLKASDYNFKVEQLSKQLQNLTGVKNEFRLTTVQLLQPAKFSNNEVFFTPKLDSLKFGLRTNGLMQEAHVFDVLSLPKQIEKITASEKDFSTALILPVRFKNNQVFTTPRLDALKTGIRVNGLTQEAHVFDVTSLPKQFEVIKGDKINISPSRFNFSYISKGLTQEAHVFDVASLPKQFEKITASEKDFKPSLILPVKFKNNQVFTTPRLDALKFGLGVEGLTQEAHVFDVANLPKPFEKMTASEKDFRAYLINKLVVPKNQTEVFYTPLMNTLKGAGLEVNGLTKEGQFLKTLNLKDSYVAKDLVYNIQASNLEKRLAKLVDTPSRVRVPYQLSNYDNQGFYDTQVLTIVGSSNIYYDVVKFYIYEEDQLELVILNNTLTTTLYFENPNVDNSLFFIPGRYVQLTDFATGQIYSAQIMASTTNSVTIVSIPNFPSTTMYGSIQGVSPTVISQIDVFLTGGKLGPQPAKNLYFFNISPKVKGFRTSLTAYTQPTTTFRPLETPGKVSQGIALSERKDSRRIGILTSAYKAREVIANFLSKTLAFGNPSYPKISEYVFDVPKNVGRIDLRELVKATRDFDDLKVLKVDVPKNPNPGREYEVFSIPVNYGNLFRFKTGDFKAGSVGIFDVTYTKPPPIQFWS